MAPPAGRRSGSPVRCARKSIDTAGFLMEAATARERTVQEHGNRDTTLYTVVPTSPWPRRTIVPVVTHAVAVFGDEAKASHSLTTSLPILDGYSPSELLVMVRPRTRRADSYKD